jgi:copper(I)-binding protein
MIRLRLLPFLALASLACAVHADDAPIKISDGWVRAAPESAKVLAAYLTIENTTDTPDVLTGVEGKAFLKVEVHRTEIKDGIARMAAVGPVEVPAHGKVALTPNGMHLMLMGADKSVRNTEKIELTLKFKNAGSVVTALPKKVAPDDPQGGHEHHHGH